LECIAKPWLGEAEMRALRSAAITALLAFTSVSATAQDVVKWAEVGGWPVIVDRTIGDGCFTYMEYNNGTVLRIGFNRSASQAYILIANQAWTSLEVGKEYDLRLIFGRAEPWDGPATAVDFNGVTALWMNFTSVDVILEFMQKQGVQIWYSNRMVDHLSLKGSFAAFSEVLRCQEAMNARPSPTDPSKDPFSGQPNQVSDPFAM
jgi:hypothetical protein